MQNAMSDRIPFNYKRYKIMKKNNTANTIAIMSVFFLAMTVGGANPIIQKMIEAYPEVSPTTVRLVSTLPSAAGMVVGLLVGTVAGNKVKFKTICIAGISFYIIGGIAPAFINSSFTSVLIARFIFGIGLGCFGCRNGIILRTYDNESSAKMLGIGVTVANIGLIVFQMITGVLGDIKWNYGFYPYFIGIVSLLLVIFLFKEPDPVETAALKSDTENTDDKEKLGALPFIYALIAMLATLWLYPLLTGMSTFIQAKGLGTAAVAGTILSLYTAGGAFAGAILGKVQKVLGRFSINYALGVVVIGQALVLYVNNIVVIAIGAILCGIGYMSITPILTSYLRSAIAPKFLAISSSIILAAAQAGVFLSSYWIKLTDKMFSFYAGTDIDRAYFAAIVMFAVTCIICFVKDVRPKQLRTK